MERPVKRRSVNSNSSNKKDHLEIIAPDYWMKPMMYRWSFFCVNLQGFLTSSNGWFHNGTYLLSACLILASAIL
jgi:hypothetical protein